LLPLTAVTPEALTARVPALDLAEARKVVSAAHRSGAACLAGPVRGVRRASLEALRAAGATVPTLETRTVRRSAVDPFVKYALVTADGHVVETVRIPLERPGRFSVCVSSQVGCALACSFCATGRMGLVRNLEAWEIVEQVRIVRAGLDAVGDRVHGVVFQGMGEPLANLDRVLEALRVLAEPCAMAVDARKVTVCTSGSPSGIRRLAREAPKVRLGLSLGSALAETRRRLMPIDRAHPLDDVLEAAAEHARTTGLAPMWAVTLLAGVNDDEAHAAALARRATAFAERAGVRPRISVIPYNAIDADAALDPFARSSEDAEAAFREAVRGGGFVTHRRYSGGADVDAACGQLAAKA